MVACNRLLLLLGSAAVLDTALCLPTGSCSLVVSGANELVKRSPFVIEPGKPLEKSTLPPHNELAQPAHESEDSHITREHDDVLLPLMEEHGPSWYLPEESKNFLDRLEAEIKDWPPKEQVNFRTMKSDKEWRKEILSPWFIYALDTDVDKVLRTGEPYLRNFDDMIKNGNNELKTEAHIGRDREVLRTELADIFKNAKEKTKRMKAASALEKKVNEYYTHPVVMGNLGWKLKGLPRPKPDSLSRKTSLQSDARAETQDSKVDVSA